MNAITSLFPNGWKLKHSIILIFTLYGILMYTLENINGRFWLNDFRVYYSAAEAFLKGDPVYGLPFGLDTGYYKYGPETLLFFIPATVLPYFVASSFHFWITLGLTIWLFLFHGKDIWGKGKKHLLIGIALFVTIVVLLTRELHLGNVNIILISALTLSVYSYEKNRFWLSAFLLAFIILTKPYFGIFVLPFVFRMQWKFLLQIGLSAIVFILFLLPFKGFQGTIDLHVEWWEAMMGHSSMLTSEQTVFSILQKISGIDIASSYGLPILFFVGLLFSFLKRKDKSIQLSMYVLIAVVPNLVVTDLEHFLFVLPLLFHHVNTWSEKSTLLKILFCAFLPFFVLEGLFPFGTLGLANLGIVILSLIPPKN